MTLDEGRADASGSESDALIYNARIYFNTNSLAEIHSRTGALVTVKFRCIFLWEKEQYRKSIMRKEGQREMGLVAENCSSFRRDCEMIYFIHGKLFSFLLPIFWYSIFYKNNILYETCIF